MRTHGTLTRCNDDRGFGFITPAKGTPDIFVHISAFPREGGRPRVNELVSFETEAGPDGRLRAVRVMRPRQPGAGHTRVARDRQHRQGRTLGGLFALLAVFAVGTYGYSRFTERVAAGDAVASGTPIQLVSPSSRYSCDGRTMCRQMTSCDEAKFFIRNCPNTQMDGDGDGEPCESQWCN